MKHFIFPTAKDCAKAASMIFAAELYQNPRLVMGLATGSTPIELYKKLIKLNEKGLIDFSQAASYNLDEYVGLTGDHDQSYRYFMNQNLFDHINIDKSRTFVPQGTGDVEQNARDYDQMIEAAGGIDLQLLGIGHNGHVGFNEPSECFTYGTNVVTLTQSTIDANSRLFADPADVPKQAISLGLGGIMSAKRVILIATGAGKADAVAGALKGPVTPENPASILQLHPNCQFFLDQEAASKL